MQSGDEAMAAMALEPLMAVPAVAQDCGGFNGFTLRVKPIGGAQTVRSMQISRSGKN